MTAPKREVHPPQRHLDAARALIGWRKDHDILVRDVATALAAAEREALERAETAERELRVALDAGGAFGHAGYEYWTERNAAREQLAAAEASVTQLQATVEQARAALEQAVDSIGECVLKHEEWDCDTGPHCADAMPVVIAALAALAGDEQPAAPGDSTRDK